MAHSQITFTTLLPDEITDLISKQCFLHEPQAKASTTINTITDKTTAPQGVNQATRNSHNSWIPTDEWIASFIWYYIQRANRENFLYDITTIDSEYLQYTIYKKGMYYHWHTDTHLAQQFSPKQTPSPLRNDASQLAMIQAEYCRKLSFSLQLSDEKEYDGGELQFHENGESWFASKQRGSLIIFDSRLNHRVRTVKAGVRKSLVGWVVGPRWK